MSRNKSLQNDFLKISSPDISRKHIPHLSRERRQNRKPHQTQHFLLPSPQPRMKLFSFVIGFIFGKGKGKATAPAESGIQASSFDLEKEYIAACEKLSFDYVSMGSEGPGSSGLVYKTYNFATLLQQTQNSTRIPRNRIHFAKELAVMATSLPPGIWVRVDEVRNDAM